MARLTLFQYRFTAAVVITLITLATIFAVRGTFSTFSDTLDLSLRDMLYRQSVHPTPVHPEITVVTIDNASLQSEASGGLGRWQDMRRTAMARVIDHLHRDGAAVIGIDALYSEPSVHPVDDAILGHAVSAAQSVVLGSSVRDSSGILLPISTIGTGAIGIGYFDQTPHPVNSTIYGIEPFLSVSGGFQQAFALTVLQKYYDTLYGQVSPFSQTVHENGTFDFYATEQERITPPITPVAGIRQMLIDWNTPKDYRTISYADVYYDRYDHAFIKDHIVLIGATATTLDDLKRTPIGIIPGIYVHANIINTIMEHAYIVPLSVMREGIVLILSLLMLSLIGVYVRRWYLLLTVVACSFGGFFVGYVWLFVGLREIVSWPTSFLGGMVVVFILVNAYHYATEDAGRKRLSRIAGQYLAHDLIERISHERETVRLGGERRTVTVFFSDIQGFTTISEDRDPEEIVRLLNTYLTAMSDTIMAHKGYINKYEGDAIMALWWAFDAEERQTELACISALEQQSKIQSLSARFRKEYSIELVVRMGIDYGQTVVGNIGNLGKKIEFTAIGDTVNRASRLEGANKIYQTRICVSEAVYGQVCERFVFRRLDRIRVKGKTQSITIYELVGHVGHVASADIERIRTFERGLAQYLARDWDRARSTFETLARMGDMPSEVFAERSRRLIETGAPDDWDGVYQAEEK